MSDHGNSAHYRRRFGPVIASSRRKKNLKIILVFALAGTLLAALVALNSGAFSDRNTSMTGQLVAGINTDRIAAGLPEIRWSSGLGEEATARGQRMKTAPLAYSQGAGLNSATSEDVFVYSKLSGELAMFGIEPGVFPSWKSGDDSFEKNILDPKFTEIGIHTESDGYNYYIIALWR